MGADRRPRAAVRLLPAAALVDARGPERADPLWPTRRGGPDDDHLFLCRDQPDDGDGTRSGGRHPAAAVLLWRFVDDAGHDLRPDDPGDQEPPQHRHPPLPLTATPTL